MSDDWKMNIQWKVTDICMDYICPSCGNQGHIDGFFCYNVKCGSCGDVYRMPSDISSLLLKVENPVIGEDIFLVSE